MAVVSSNIGFRGLPGALDLGAVTIATGAPGTQVTYSGNVLTIPRGQPGTGGSGGGFAPARDIRDFGVVVTGFGEKPVDNLAAFTAALQWSHAEGGCIALPNGVIGVEGTLPLLSYATIKGVSRYNSIVRQLHIATSDLTSYADVFAGPPLEAGGTAFVTLESFGIDGGWTMRDYEGKGGQLNWGHDPARMTQRGIFFTTPAGGPGSAVTRSDITDAHNRFVDIGIRNVAGIGIQASGRGESQFRGLDVSRCGKHGIYMDSPDCWLSDSTFWLTGDSGAVYTGSAGDHRAVNVKTWFCGMQKAVQPVGAGLQIAGQGVKNLNFLNWTTQDTWGPGVVLQGAFGISYDGSIDEPGGGRLEQQAFGYTGTRTLERCAIRADGTFKASEVRARVFGGGRTSVRPIIVHLSGSGVQDNRFHLGGELTNYRTPYVLESLGTLNARCYNEVWHKDRLLHGQVTQANLGDPTHGVNGAVYGPGRAYRTDGVEVKRRTDGSWSA